MRKQDRISDSPSRRSFLARLAGAAALPAALDVLVGATPVLAAPAQTEPSESAEVEAYTAIVTARFGHYLQSADMTVIHRDLEQSRRMAVQLQKFPLHNGDAPDCLFHPDGA